MQAYIFWFVLAGFLLVAEMVSGTFYMLVLSLAAAAGGLAALLGLGMPAQLSIAAIIAVTGTLFLRSYKAAQKQPAVESQNLDRGQPVRVESWLPNGSARVLYRGSYWDAELESTETAREQTLYIKEIRNNVLVLSNKKPV